MKQINVNKMYSRIWEKNMQTIELKQLMKITEVYIYIYINVICVELDNWNSLRPKWILNLYPPQKKKRKTAPLT